MKKSILIFWPFLLLPMLSYAQTACYSGMLNLPPAIFSPAGGIYASDYLKYNSLTSNREGESTFVAPIMLPDGAKITQIVAKVYDYTRNAKVEIELASNTTYAGGTVRPVVGTSFLDDAGDYSLRSVDLDYDIDNVNHSYYLNAIFDNSDGTSKAYLVKVEVYYELYECPGGVVVIPMW